MGTYLILIAVFFGIVSIAFLILGWVTLKKKQIFGSTISLSLGILFLLMAGFSAVLTVSVQGYRALTREKLIAVVETRPTGRETFEATFYFPDKTTSRFVLAGDELYVDAHILKWKPMTNILGIHTLYELDRVAGRYASLQDEQTKMRTVYSLARTKPLNLFDLRRRYPVLEPLVDAEYGSATFIMARNREQFELRVSTTGLLLRKVEL
ncbi:MAG TPA: hypothetical protein VKA68_15960 [bacterium]|nr:hypothetical protein [bacterium]